MRRVQKDRLQLVVCHGALNMFDFELVVSHSPCGTDRGEGPFDHVVLLLPVARPQQSRAPAALRLSQPPPFPHPASCARVTPTV
jgi:hypothetical protein